MSKNESSQETSCGCGCCGGKRLSGKAWLVLTVIVFLIIRLAIWSQAASCCAGEPASAAPTGVAVADPPAAPAPSAPAIATQTVAIPKLLDLGATKCIPCKMMAPILDELGKEYQGQLAVEFIDVWKDREAGTKHKIQLIPTQIFFAADGKELFRHEGFFAKKDILAKWKELGVTLPPPATPVPAKPGK